MPHLVVPPTIVRSTLCFGSDTVTVRLMCPDRIPRGVPSQLAVGVQWEPEKPDGEVVLELRRLASGPVGGDARFDGVGGESGKTLRGNVAGLLPLVGTADTAGALPDVLVGVKFGGRDQGSVRLSVGATAATVEVRDESGAGPAADSLPVGIGRTVRAVPAPAGAGTFAWLALQPSELAVPAGAAAETVEVTARTPGGAPPVSAARPLVLCVLFTPAGGAGVMGVHRFTRLGNLFGRIEDRSIAPEHAAAAADQVFLPPGTPFEIRDPAGATVFRGTTEADGYFAATVAGSGPFELVVPGFEGLTV